MTTSIPIEAIRHRPDARHRSDEALNALAESMDEIGLINPILVRHVGDGQFEVVAGSHRLQAAELNGWREIAALVTDDDDLHAEMAMIDENLVRTELSPTERAQQTARRKAIHLALHPETAQYVAGAHASNLVQGNATDNLSTASFTSETARLIGKDERTIRRDAERGEKVSPEALNIARGTRLDTGIYLDRLKRLPANEQAESARRDLAHRFQPAPPKPAPPKPSPDASFTAFTTAADTIEGLDVRTLIEGAARQRSVLGQRASGIADRMAEILEGLG